MKHDFLLYIGLYNLLGLPLFAALQHPKLATALLVRWTELFQAPMEYGRFGRLWMWWIGSLQGFMGTIMLLALRWPEQLQREVIIVTVSVYALMEVVLIVGGRRPQFGRGVWVTHGLWLAQIGWGLWALKG